MTVSSPNFTSQSTEGINLDVGVTYSADFTVSNEIVKMEAVRVAAARM